MTFYLKYRSNKIDELDLKDVRESLKKIVTSGKIPHAFLFSGPKGTGKTSAARILAKVVNCESTSKKLRGQGNYEPCNKCMQCISISKGENLDVIELDAASHRGIDDIRSLRDAVKLAPAKAKRKVYIIDEAHMLTTEASNALLKTLEEPPEHVIFILATTNPEKLIGTIRSRTTSIVFRKAKPDELLRALRRVAKGEKLKVSDDVLSLFAQFSDGSFRDAIKLVEKAIVEDVKFDKDSVEAFLNSGQVFDIDKFISYLLEKKAKEAIKMIESGVEVGTSPKDINKAIVERLREALLSNIGLEKEGLGIANVELIELTEVFNEASKGIGYSLIDQLPLELAVIKWCENNGSRQYDNGESGKRNTGEGTSANSSSKDKISVSGKNTNGIFEVGVNSINNNALASDDQTSSVQPKSGNGEAIPESVESIWGEMLLKIRQINASTEALLRASRPMSYSEGILRLGVYYRFHKERLESNPHRDILEKVLSELLENKVRLVCELTQPPIKKTSETIEVEEVHNSGMTNGGSSTVGTNDKDGELTKGESDSVLTETDDEDIISIAKEIFDS